MTATEQIRTSRRQHYDSTLTHKVSSLDRRTPVLRQSVNAEDQNKSLTYHSLVRLRAKRCITAKSSHAPPLSQISLARPVTVRNPSHRLWTMLVLQTANCHLFGDAPEYRLSLWHSHVRRCRVHRVAHRPRVRNCKHCPSSCRFSMLNSHGAPYSGRPNAGSSVFAPCVAPDGRSPRKASTLEQRAESRVTANTGSSKGRLARKCKGTQRRSATEPSHVEGGYEAHGVEARTRGVCVGTHADATEKQRRRSQRRHRKFADALVIVDSGQESNRGVGTSIAASVKQDAGRVLEGT